MNRQQRRRARKEEGSLGMVNLDEVVMPPQMPTAMVARMTHDRIEMNFRQTGHPFHHLTATEVMVEPDPTLEYYLKRLEKEDSAMCTTLKVKADTLSARATTAPQTVPVNRKFYGYDPYEQH